MLFAYLPIFGPFFHFFRKMRMFLKNGVWGSLYPLMPSNFYAKYEKNLMRQFWAIYKKVDFFKLLRPLLALYLGKRALFQKIDNNVLWLADFMRKCHIWENSYSRDLYAKALEQPDRSIFQITMFWTVLPLFIFFCI